MLIDFYQWEIVRIKKSIEENLELQYYKEIEFDQRALVYAQSELDRLLELKNPLHPKIKRTQQTIKMYERMKQKRDSSNEELFWTEYYDEKIKEQKKNLNRLEKEKVEHGEESQFIDEAIYSLLNGEASKFRLRFDETNDYSISILLLKDSIFKLDFYAPESEISWLYEHTFLKDLGFESKEQSAILSREFRLENSKNALPLKELISTVVIGLKYPLRIKDKIYLEVD